MSANRTASSEKKSRTKVGSSARPSRSEGTSVLLGRRNQPGSPLRIGTLSWGVVDAWQQSPNDLLATVATAAASHGNCDLIVAAGLTVSAAPSARTVLRASGGTPVLFEIDAGANGRSWLLAHRSGDSPQNVLLRRRQLAQRFDDYEGFRRIAGAVAGHAGVIEFEGADVRLVLLICGENNSVNPYAARSVFKRLPDKPEEAARLRGVLGKSWVMLNPAHARYYPQVLPTGFGKVGVVRTGEDQWAGPTLRWLAERTRGYRDRTMPPMAVIHVNNFDPEHPETEEYAAISFGHAGAQGRPASGTVASGSPYSRSKRQGRGWALAMDAG